MIAGLYAGITWKRKINPAINAITDPIPHETNIPNAPSDTRNIGIGSLDAPNIDSFRRTYFAVRSAVKILFNKVVMDHTHVKVIKRSAKRRFDLKKRSFGEKTPSPSKNIMVMTADAVRLNVKQEFIISFFWFDVGRNLISATLKPSRDNIERRDIADIIVDPRPTSSDV